MLAGNPSNWLKKFRNGEERLIGLIPAVWPKCSAGLSNQPLEDHITNNLVGNLHKLPDLRKLGLLTIQHTLLQEQVRGDVTTKGRIDIALSFNRDHDCYIAFECKRLNIMFKSGISPCAIPYVNLGMMRYVTAQYAKKLPLGGMIGYVLNQDVDNAKKRVIRAIKSRKRALLSNGDCADLGQVGYIHRFKTEHNRPGDFTPFEICHTILPYPSP